MSTFFFLHSTLGVGSFNDFREMLGLERHKSDDWSWCTKDVREIAKRLYPT